MKLVIQKKNRIKYRKISMDDYVKECIDKALSNKRIYKNIKYNGKAYNFKTGINKKEFSYKIHYMNTGFGIYLQDDKKNDVAWITVHLTYPDGDRSGIKTLPYQAHIQRLGVKEEYRKNGYATYLICVSLLVAHMLGVKEITVHNTCAYQELYSLFEYNSTKIKEYK